VAVHTPAIQRPACGGERVLLIDAAADTSATTTTDITPNLSINGRFSASKRRPSYETVLAAKKAYRHGQARARAEAVHWGLPLRCSSRR